LVFFPFPSSHHFWFARISAGPKGNHGAGKKSLLFDFFVFVFLLFLYFDIVIFIFLVFDIFGILTFFCFADFYSCCSMIFFVSS